MKLILTILILCFVTTLIYAIPSKLRNYNKLGVGHNIKYILPKTTIPHHYDVELNLNIGPDEYNYNGYVNINITVLQKTNILILHADSQKILLDKSYLKYNLEKIHIINYTEIEKNNFLILNLEKDIIPGNYNLILIFEQKYFEQAGLVLKTYKENGQNKNMLGTYFEPVYARRIFPCFDEPNYKATFTISVTHPKEFNAVSNGEIDEIIKSPINDNKIETKFKKTPIMSTYLLALCVSDYQSFEENYNNINLRIFAPPTQVINTKYALNITRESLKFFDQLFKINYDLPKLDSFIFPRFGGGMENWALIAYGELILIDEKSTSIIQKIMYPTELICHEVAHQWFGNLVTLDWWDYAWLNEGFAMYYSEICGDMIIGNKDTIRFMDKHVISLKDMLLSDSNPQSSKALNEHVELPNNVMGKFDNYSYRKGSAIVRFMSFIFQNFDQAIINYLQRYQYSTARPIDLYNVLEETANLPNGIHVKDIMNNWLDLKGYPLITFNITKRGEKSTVVVQQEQFNTNPNANANGKWWIPMILVKENEPNFNNFEITDWLTDTADNLVMNIDNIEDGWVLLNPQAAVFCRVNYDLENWQRIINFLKGPNFEQIHPINRARLIDDANNLARANKLPEYIVLDLLSYLQQERDPLIRNSARSTLVTYSELLKETRAYPNFVSFVKEIYGEKESNHIFAEPNIKDLTENLIRSFSNNKHDSVEAFSEIANRIYTESDLQKIHSVTGILPRTAMLPNYHTEFIDKIEIRYQQNKINKHNFMINNSFDDVNKWLNKRYKKF